MYIIYIYYTIQLFPCFTSCLSSTNGQESLIHLPSWAPSRVHLHLPCEWSPNGLSQHLSGMTNANMWAGAWMPPLASCSPGLQGASAVLPGLCSKVSITECHTGNLQCRAICSAISDARRCADCFCTQGMRSKPPLHRKYSQCSTCPWSLAQILRGDYPQSGAGLGDKRWQLDRQDLQGSMDAGFGEWFVSETPKMIKDLCWPS